MTTSDPRWQRGDGGWWHWPDGADAWQWIPDPPAPATPIIPVAEPSPVYVQAAPKRRRWPWVAAVLILVIVAGSAISQQGPDTSATVQTGGPGGTQNVSTSPVGIGGFPLQDGDWRLDSLTVAKEVFGDFKGRGKVTYTGSDRGGGDNYLEITIYTGASSVASMSATIDNVPPGYSKTIDFYSTDDYVPGSHRFTFEAGWF